MFSCACRSGRPPGAPEGSLGFQFGQVAPIVTGEAPVSSASWSIRGWPLLQVRIACRPPAGPPRAPYRARNGTATVFAANGFALASWMSRVPDVKARLDLAPGKLSILLLVISAGSVLGLPIMPWFHAAFSLGTVLGAVLGARPHLAACPDRRPHASQPPSAWPPSRGEPQDSRPPEANTITTAKRASTVGGQLRMVSLDRAADPAHRRDGARRGLHRGHSQRLDGRQLRRRESRRRSSRSHRRSGLPVVHDHWPLLGNGCSTARAGLVLRTLFGAAIVGCALVVFGHLWLAFARAALGVSGPARIPCRHVGRS